MNNQTSSTTPTQQDHANTSTQLAADAPTSDHTAPVIRLSRGLSTFVNWFNGICAPVCGAWMMASALFNLPLSWNSWMPLSIYDPFPFHDVFFTSHFWPGLALLLVNGVPNIIALIARRREGEASWARWCIVAGALLLVWTTTELILIPNGLSVFYFALGVLQTAAAIHLTRTFDKHEA